MVSKLWNNPRVKTPLVGSQSMNLCCLNVLCDGWLSESLPTFIDRAARDWWRHLTVIAFQVCVCVCVTVSVWRCGVFSQLHLFRNICRGKWAMCVCVCADVTSSLFIFFATDVHSFYDKTGKKSDKEMVACFLSFHPNIKELFSMITYTGGHRYLYVTDIETLSITFFLSNCGARMLIMSKRICKTCNQGPVLKWIWGHENIIFLWITFIKKHCQGPAERGKSQTALLKKLLCSLGSQIQFFQ